MSTFIIYGIITGGLVLSVLFWPAMALAAVLCTFGLEQWAQSKDEFFFAHGTLTNYIIGSIVVIALGSKFLRGQRTLRPYPRVGWVVVALFAFALTSLFWSVYEQGTLEQWAKRWPYVVTFILLCPLVVSDARDLRIGLLSTLTIGTFLLALLMFDTQWVGRQIVLSRGVMMGTVISRHGNPLAIASLAGTVALIALLMNFTGLARFWQIVRWGVVALALAASIRTGSRGQLFALLVAGCVFLPISRRITNFRGFAATTIAVAVMLFLASWAFEEYAGGARRWETERMFEAYEGGRINTALRVLSYWAERPQYWLTGLGSSASFSPDILGFYPHVVMVEVLAEEGIIGFVLLWTVVILSYRSIRRLYRAVRDQPVQRGLLAALGALLLFEVILTFKQGSMLGSQMAFAFAIIIGRYDMAVVRSAVPVSLDGEDPFPEAAHGWPQQS